jgi:lipid II:glycine glycyltransferase (peptidoglycan interpeptide bridge formation enzyme)
MGFSIEWLRAVPVGWDAGLLNAGIEAGFQQSAMWANLLAAMDGAVPHFATVRDENGPVLAALFISSSKGKMPYFRKSVVCNDGPVFLRPDPDPETEAAAVRKLLESVDQQLLAGQVAAVRFGGMTTSSKRHGNASIQDAFQDFGYRTDRWATILNDLSGTRDGLLSRLASSAREKVRKGERLGIQIREDTGVEDFLENFNSIYQASGIKTPIPERRLRAGYDAGSADCYRYLLASDQDGVPLAVAGIAMFGRIALRVSSAITPAARERRIPAQDVVTWQSMLLAKKLGADIYDFAGVNPAPQSEKEIGILEFKRKWGGYRVDYNRWEKESLLLQTLAWVPRKMRALMRSMR